MTDLAMASARPWDQGDRTFVPTSAPHDSTGDHIVESCDEFDNRFRIRVASKARLRSRASSLIERRYAWRGYSISPLEGHTSGQVTLCASVDEATVATITATLDSPDGLYVSRLYPDEVRQLQQEGRKLCEFTRLAVDESVRSQAILGAIFHVACIYVLNLHRCSDVLIEVNPRHVRFYERMLGFRRVGEERLDPAVNAPAVLMRLDLARSPPRDASARSIRISSPRATRSRSSAGCASTEPRREGAAAAS